MNTSPMVHPASIVRPVRVSATRRTRQKQSQRPLILTERGLAIVRAIGWLIALAGTSAATWAAITHRSTDTTLLTNFDEFFAVFTILTTCVIFPGVVLATYRPKKVAKAQKR